MVSVIIPVYNREARIRVAIESVLAQTYQNFEILVVDDGSTDGTAGAVIAIDDPRVRLIRHDRNRGGSAARNTGIRAGSGEYVAFLDSDDEWAPPKLERQVAVFERSTERVGLVYTGADHVYAGGRVRRVIPRLRGDLSCQLLRTNSVGSCSVAMVRRTGLDQVAGFDESLPARQDVDLWLRIARRSVFEVVPESLATISKVNDSTRITANVANRMKAREMFCSKHREQLLRDGCLHLYLRSSGWKYYRELRDSPSARACYRQSLASMPTAVGTYVLWLASWVPVSIWDHTLRWRRVAGRFLRRSHRRESLLNGSA